MNAFVLRLFLVLAILFGAVGHRDAAMAHTDGHAVEAAHDVGSSDDPPGDDHPGHVSHHHCPLALNSGERVIVSADRFASGHRVLPPDMARLPSRAIAPMPEPPTA